VIKQKLVFNKKRFSGKQSKFLYKELRKAKSKKELKAFLYSLYYDLQDMEYNLYELKNFVGKKTKYN
jgi:hypothetical protein